MDERSVYNAVSMTEDEANLYHIVKQAIKCGCAECDSCKYQAATYDPHTGVITTKCKVYNLIRKPDEARIGKCCSFSPYNIDNTKRMIKIHTDKEEEAMQKLYKESEERNKEIFSNVRAMRVMARLVAHEVKKIMSSQPLPPIPVNIPDLHIDERVKLLHQDMRTAEEIEYMNHPVVGIRGDFDLEKLHVGDVIYMPMRIHAIARDRMALDLPEDSGSALIHEQLVKILERHEQ